jgi:hypothetical protein
LGNTAIPFSCSEAERASRGERKNESGRLPAEPPLEPTIPYRGFYTRRAGKRG